MGAIHWGESPLEEEVVFVVPTRGANLRELMDRMGHSSTRAALIYLHSSDAWQRALADAVGKAACVALRKDGKASGTKVARSRRWTCWRPKTPCGSALSTHSTSSAARSGTRAVFPPRRADRLRRASLALIAAVTIRARPGRSNPRQAKRSTRYPAKPADPAQRPEPRTKPLMLVMLPLKTQAATLS
jgi:hypothetical protein